MYVVTVYLKKNSCLPQEKIIYFKANLFNVTVPSDAQIKEIKWQNEKGVKKTLIFFHFDDSHVYQIPGGKLYLYPQQ